MRKPLVRTAIAATALAVVCTAALTGCSKYSGNEDNCTVTGKYVSYDDKTSSKRVETTCGVFTADDDPFHGVYNSADIYAALRENHTYDLVAYGARNPFFSMFPNIASYTEVTR